MPRRPGLDPKGQTETFPERQLLTEETREALLRMLRAGNYIETACRAAGITSKTFRNWRRAHREGQVSAIPYAKFFEDLDKAIAEGETTHLNAIELAAKSGQWQAAAWVLERRHPRRWGRRDVIEVMGVKDKDLSKLSDEDLAKIQAKVKRSRG